MNRFPLDDELARAFGADELNKCYELVDDIEKNIYEVIRRADKDWKFDQMNPSLITLALASATLRPFLRVMFLAEKMRGNPRFQTLNHFDAIVKEPDAFFELVECILSVLASMLSRVDPSSSYVVQIIKKDKDQH